MSDFLLQLGQNPQARRLIKALGLPVPIPQTLRRARGPWEERPLADKVIVVGGMGAGRMAAPVAKMLAESGAEPIVIGDALDAFRAPGEAFGRPARAAQLGELPEGKFDGVVFDASELAEPAALRALYEHFHAVTPRLAAGGRAVVIGRAAATAKTPEAAATRRALEGFVRSLAKEVGKRGATAQLLIVDDGAEARGAEVLRFVLSPRAAFITGQPIHVTGEVTGKAPPTRVRALEKKVALVTGAARGIGEATAHLLSAEGAHVVCLDRPEDDALVSKVARDIGGSVLLVDITDPHAPKKIADELRAAHGGVDVVVHNAGVTRDKTIGNMTAEQWEQAVDINLGAVVRITSALLAGVLRDGGRIVCLSSVAGIAGNVGQTNYAASKSGLIGYVEKLAPALAPRGITVNAIAPGFIETRLTAAIPMMIREAGRRLSALGQGGLPQDVAEAISFLAQPASVGITGSVLRVCGGALIGA
ncbi:MAG: 3-oxoacyl-ACP reductase [Kofleriaceae bacterium]|nr:3-oxoacyl-ACP reductase [Myxococcales bacterium]MCB9564794.1 3-oxoacyl-ACP reductase [Kofleriaceae bacterium]MCB9574661.1 3-oxoacyl-ACP reductase [Kofleriaceae bacterium]